MLPLLYIIQPCKGNDSQTSDRQDVPNLRDVGDGVARLGEKVMATAAPYNVFCHSCTLYSRAEAMTFKRQTDKKYLTLETGRGLPGWVRK